MPTLKDFRLSLVAGLTYLCVVSFLRWSRVNISDQDCGTYGINDLLTIRQNMLRLAVDDVKIAGNEDPEQVISSQIKRNFKLTAMMI